MDNNISDHHSNFIADSEIPKLVPRNSVKSNGKLVRELQEPTLPVTGKYTVGIMGLFSLSRQEVGIHKTGN